MQFWTINRKNLHFRTDFNLAIPEQVSLDAIGLCIGRVEPGFLLKFFFDGYWCIYQGREEESLEDGTEDVVS